jgi:hypothetical protein
MSRTGGRGGQGRRTDHVPRRRKPARVADAGHQRHGPVVGAANDKNGLAAHRANNGLPSCVFQRRLPSRSRRRYGAGRTAERGALSPTTISCPIIKLMYTETAKRRARIAGQLRATSRELGRGPGPRDRVRRSSRGLRRSVRRRPRRRRHTRSGCVHERARRCARPTCGRP